VNKPPERILLSRTDSIGDVMLTLPLAGLLKRHFPGVRIAFLGRNYTAPVLHCCSHIDEVITLDDLNNVDPKGSVQILAASKADTVVHVFPERNVARWCKEAGIPQRIGTGHRWWHWTTCTERVSFSRRKSDLHEAQLNVKLLAPLGVTDIPTLADLAALSGFRPSQADEGVRALLVPGKRNIILHPLSKGSAVEWGLDRFTELIHALDPHRYHVIVTGTAAEAELYRKGLPLRSAHVTDAGGRLSLDRLIALIGASDALVAASTGPLHIAAACGKRAIGLYASKRPIHPGRWAPIGADAHALTAAGTFIGGDPVQQIHAIGAERVVTLLEALP
jgi:heptosyltransferase III